MTRIQICPHSGIVACCVNLAPSKEQEAQATRPKTQTAIANPSYAMRQHWGNIGFSYDTAECATHACTRTHTTGIFTRLSSLFATMEAKRLSPASSEMRKMYSGAVTWLDRWVRPEKQNSNMRNYFDVFNSWNDTIQLSNVFEAWKQTTMPLCFLFHRPFYSRIYYY